MLLIGLLINCYLQLQLLKKDQKRLIRLLQVQQKKELLRKIQNKTNHNHNNDLSFSSNDSSINFIFITYNNYLFIRLLFLCKLIGSNYYAFNFKIIGKI